MERVLETGVFWDIYYEHCTYFTRGSLARLFRAEGFDVKGLYKAYDDQYLMIEAKPVDGPTVATLPQEDDLASTAALVKKFTQEVDSRLQELSEAAHRWRRSGQKVAIWGSGSKCVSLLSSIELGDTLQAIVDINPHKHGKFLAGSGWEIEGPDALTALRPDAVIIMNSIYTEEIRNELATRGLQPELLPL
jgi:C-methyltransferase C-terminal domain